MNQKPKKRSREHYIIAAAAVRKYIAANPGKTAEEIYEAVPDGRGTLMELLTRRMVRVEGKRSKTDKNAPPPRWYVVANNLPVRYPPFVASEDGDSETET
jgi:hypothetical protein